MSRRTVRVLCAIVLGVCIGVGGTAGTVPTVSAEEHVLDLNSPDAIKQVLEQQVGKRVKVKLLSGQDLEGKVAKVGSHAVQFSELSGMEFFDATVRMDQVAAVIVRVRTK
jgi:hypothetical protein